MSTNSNLEVISFVPGELEAADRAALPDAPWLLRVVVAVLSRFIGEWRSKDAADIYQLCRALKMYAATADAMRVGVAEAIWDEVATTSCPNPRTVLRRVGTTRSALREQWQTDVHTRGGERAHLDIETLRALVPVRLWIVVAVMVLDGPGVATARVEALLHRAARLPAPVTRARPQAATLSASTVSLFAAALRRVMNILVDLRVRGMFLPEVGAWTALPRLRMPDVIEAHTDTSAPSIALLRRVWRELNNDIRRRLACSALSDEVRAAATVSIQRLHGTWGLVRMRGLVMLLLITGGRIGATLALTNADYVRGRLCANGQVQPSIGLKPGKTLPEEEVCWRPIPFAAATVLDVMQVVVERLPDRLPPSLDYAEHPGATLDPTWALFRGTLGKPHRAWTAKSVWEAFVGREPSAGHPNGTSPLFPKPVADGDAPFGYSPHAFKGAATQLVRSGGPDYCAEHEISVDPEAISEVLTDHAVKSDRYGYADIATRLGREKWCAVGAEINWQMLDGDRGAKRIPDREQYQRLLHERADLDEELRRLTQLSDETVRRARNRDVVGTESLLEVLAATDRRARVQTRRAEVAVSLAKLRSDRSTWVVVPDGADPPPVDFDELERQILGRAVDPGDDTRAPVRDWLTVTELGKLAGVSPATPPRWVRGESLPRQPGDPRRPWEPDAIPVDETLGPRRRRILVAGLKPGFFGSDLHRRHLAEVLSGWPEGWSEAHCAAPIKIADSVLARLHDRGLEVPR